MFFFVTHCFSKSFQKTQICINPPLRPLCTVYFNVQYPFLCDWLISVIEVQIKALYLEGDKTNLIGYYCIFRSIYRPFWNWDGFNFMGMTLKILWITLGGAASESFDLNNEFEKNWFFLWVSNWNQVGQECSHTMNDIYICINF